MTHHTRLFALATLLVAAPVFAQCPLPAAGTSLGQNGILLDGWTPVQPIGFAFPFKGSTFDGVYISDHGVVALTDFASGVPLSPPAGGWVYTPTVGNLTTSAGPLLSVYWSDHSISYGINVGEIYMDYGGGSQCTISWIDAETYIDGAPWSVSVTLHSDGRIVYTFDNRVTNDGSTFGALNAVIGIGLPGGTNVAVNLNTDVLAGSDSFSEEFVTSAPLTPNPNFDVDDMALTFLDVGIGSGWAIVQDSLPCAGTVSVGAGCDGLSLAPTTSPVVGQSWDLTMSGVNPTSVAFALPNFLAFGASIPATPIGVLVPDLFGLACFAYQDASLGLIDGGPASITGDVLFSLSIPNTVFLANAPLSCQGVSIRDLFVTPTFSLTNGIDGTIGY